MPAFKYIAYDKYGKKLSGVIEAEAKESAILSLKNRGLYPETLATLETDQERFSKIFTIRRLSKRLIGDIAFQLATLLNSGIPLTEAIKIVATQIKNERLKNILLNIRDKVNQGTKFSVALEQYNNIFDPVYIKMISIAEKTGNLSQALFTIADYEEKKNNFTQRIASAAIYPAFILSMGSLVVCFLIIYVIPKMKKIFESLHKDLPLVTKILISSSSFLKENFISFILTIAGIIITCRLLYQKNEKFRHFIETILLKIPLYRKFLIARFSSSLAFQLKAGLSLIDGIIQASKVVNNEIFHHQMEEVANKIRDGAPIDTSFAATGIFDEMFIASISTGQKTGSLEEFIQRMANYYEKKIDIAMNRTISLVEPIFILLLGLIVGFIVMAIMIPLFEINQLIR